MARISLPSLPKLPSLPSLPSLPPLPSRPSMPWLPAFPRPQSFFYFMSLRTGTELILLTVVINKISGLYGLLAPLTGFGLSPLQASMYIYSIIALVLTVILAQGMRPTTSSSSSSRSPTSTFATLAFAYLYAIDSIINAAYTTAFSVAWFNVLANGSHHGGKLGSGTIDDTAGFTDPEHNVSRVEVVAEPAGLSSGQNAVSMGVKEGESHGGVMNSGSIASISVVCLLWALRTYFVLVVLAYARQVLRSHVAAVGKTDYYGQHGSAQGYQSTSASSPSLSSCSFSAKNSVSTGSSGQPSATAAAGRSSSETNTASSTGNAPAYTSTVPATTTPQDANLAENPFAPYREDGVGWRGSLGRFMLSIGPTYWLGFDEEEEWARGLGDRFRLQHQEFLKQQHEANEQGGLYGYQYGQQYVGPSVVTPPLPPAAEGSSAGGVGVAERERRRRSGTGPPVPVDMPRFVGV